MTELAWVVGIGIALYLLFRFPRQTGIFVGAIVAIGLSVFGYFAVQDMNKQRELALIDAAADGSSDMCKDPNYPVWVSLINKGPRTVTRVSYSLEAKRPGYSGITYSDYQSTDRIIAPNQGFGQCWAIREYANLAETPASLNWTIKLYSADYE